MRPSISTIEIPGRSPAARAPSASEAIEPVGASQITRSAARPAAITPQSSLYTRAVLPVAHAIASAGGNPPSAASTLSVRSTPSGITPVPHAASLPRMRRGAPPGAHLRRGGPTVRVRLRGDARGRLGPAGALGRPGRVPFARRDRRGHAAVHAGVDEVHGALAWGEVAEDRMDVRVDQPR